MKRVVRTTSLIAMPLAVAMLVLGCGSEEPAADQRACTPGMSQACVGPGACKGGQACKADGSAYGPCDCGAGVGGSGGGPPDGSAGSASVCPTGLPGPALVEVKSPTGVAYCIDATEVTFGQYDEFLAAKVDPKTQQGQCLQQNVFSSPQFLSCRQAMENTSASAPVGCVTWCDAVGYCKWAGKRLCGKIGGGAADITKPADAIDSQWFNACSAGGTRMYAYGDEGVSECWEKYPRAAVATRAACTGPYPGLFDLSGNAEEWEDSCLSVAQGDACRVRSGDPCASSSKPSWFHVHATKGFRCCHDGT
ncbi:MAG: hypothetical protein AMXMBFR56_78410 [Polyangiaceae bacterium]